MSQRASVTSSGPGLLEYIRQRAKFEFDLTHTDHTDDSQSPDSQAAWPNGKALLSGGKDCGFESHRRRRSFLHPGIEEEDFLGAGGWEKLALFLSVSGK